MADAPLGWPVMPSPADRPVIFLDVDGPLIPFAARPSDHPPQGAGYDPAAERLTAGANPLLDRLNPDDGRRLLALGCDLVWATTWMAEANEVISPRLGLAELPVVDWTDTDAEPVRRLHWNSSSRPVSRWVMSPPESNAASSSSASDTDRSRAGRGGPGPLPQTTRVDHETYLR
jgi:hypothetical protein